MGITETIKEYMNCFARGCPRGVGWLCRVDW